MIFAEIEKLTTTDRLIECRACGLKFVKGTRTECPQCELDKCASELGMTLHHYINPQKYHEAMEEHQEELKNLKHRYREKISKLKQHLKNAQIRLYRANQTAPELSRAWKCLAKQKQSEIDIITEQLARFDGRAIPIETYRKMKARYHIAKNEATRQELRRFTERGHRKKVIEKFERFKELRLKELFQSEMLDTHMLWVEEGEGKSVDQVYKDWRDNKLAEWEEELEADQ